MTRHDEAEDEQDDRVLQGLAVHHAAAGAAPVVHEGAEQAEDRRRNRKQALWIGFSPHRSRRRPLSTVGGRPALDGGGLRGRRIGQGGRRLGRRAAADVSLSAAQNRARRVARSTTSQGKSRASGGRSGSSSIAAISSMDDRMIASIG